MKVTQKKNRSKAFTLIEVMFALAIIGIALTAVIRVTGNAASNQSWLMETTFAQWIALNRLAELKLENSWPNTGKSNGKVEFADVQWYWLQEVIKTPEEDFRRVDISVYKLKIKNNEPVATVTSFFTKKGSVIAEPSL